MCTTRVSFLQGNYDWVILSNSLNLLGRGAAYYLFQATRKSYIKDS